jgi:hypothetical protein
MKTKNKDKTKAYQVICNSFLRGYKKEAIEQIKVCTNPKDFLIWIRENYGSEVGLDIALEYISSKIK